MKQAASYSGRKASALESWGKKIGTTTISPGLRKWLRKSFHLLLQLRTGGRGIECRLPQGEMIHVLPEFRFVAWNMNEYKAFREAVRPGSVALDVGANIGAYSLLLGQWVQPGGRVYAFEPMPTIFSALERHIALNQLGSSITPINAAASDRDGRAALVRGDSLGASRLASGSESANTVIERVEVTTLDTFCAARSLTPDFIKIDVEGFEISVLRGARNTIQNGRGRLALFVELHPTTWREIGVTREDFLGELDRQELTMRVLGAEGDPWSVEGICVQLMPK